MMRCAVVEYNWYHDLVLPTLVLALNELGFEVDVYQPRKAFEADPFCFSPGLRYRRLAIDGFLANLRGTPRRGWRYDLTIANSIEPESALRAAAGLSGPLLAVVHNGSLLVTEPAYARFFDLPHRAPIVLARHIAQFLDEEWKPGWIAPVYFGDVPEPDGRPPSVVFCVQGGFAFDRRNYMSLVTAAGTLLDSGQDAFTTMFVGSSDTPDGVAFRTQLAGTPLEAHAHFTSSGIPYREFYPAVSGADFVLPLVDTTSPRYASYYFDKATTSLMMSIGLGVPPILHSRLAQLYDLTEAGICYENGRLGEAMSRALALGSVESARLTAGIAARRDALLAENVENLRRAVDGLG